MCSVEIITPVQDYTFMESWHELSDQSHFWFRGRLAAFLKQLDDLQIPIDQAWRVLDVGCGTGVLREQVEAATAWNIDAADLDYKALQISAESRGRTMYYDITTRNDLLKESYDGILLFDVLEHIEITEGFIEALLFHLKPGGYLFINVPAIQLLFSRYDEVQGHFRRYNKSSLAREFRAFPVILRDSRYWGISNVMLVAIRKLVLGITGRRRSREEIFRDGFKPPARILNEALVGIMKAELALVSRPPVGSSIMVALQKTK